MEDNTAKYWFSWF